MDHHQHEAKLTPDLYVIITWKDSDTLQVGIRYVWLARGRCDWAPWIVLAA